MPGRDPWKNRKSVKICAFIDMIFALVVITAYTLRLTFDNKLEDGTTRGFFRPSEKPGVTIVFWSLAYILNVLQLLISYLLFAVVSRSVGEADGIPRAKNWLVIANVGFVMLIAKFIYFVFFDRANESILKIILFVFCVLELFFKAYAMYFVKEFLDDLKSMFNTPQAKVKQRQTV